MIVTINNLKVNLDSLKKIGSGLDGYIYLFGDKIIKINESDYMTEEKVRDLQVAKDSKRLIVPIDIVNPTPLHLLKAENPCFGYTTKYLPEDKFGLLSLSTLDFLEQMELLKREIREYFTRNEIALKDHSARNLLISGGVIHLIDFDRNITKSSMYACREAIINNGHKDPYDYHNNRRVDLMAYRALLLAMLEYCEKEKKSTKKLIPYIEAREEFPTKVKEFITELIRYDTLYDYAKEKVKRIIR